MTARGILVFGGSGQLGTALAERLARRDESFAVPPRKQVDLSNDDPAAAIDAYAPRAVVNASAYNDVDGAELATGRPSAFRLNRDAPAAMARACARRGIPFAHVSTDYVFDGRATRPYTEADPVAPLQLYGRSKLDGERAVAEAHSGALVVRTSTVFGPNRRGATNYVAAILAQARKRDAIEVVRLPISSPTYAPDLAEALLALLAAGVTGLVHVANAGACSRLELASAAVASAGLAGRVRVLEREPATVGAARPAYSVLDSSLYCMRTGRAMRPWQETLADYVPLLAS